MTAEFFTDDGVFLLHEGAAKAVYRHQTKLAGPKFDEHMPDVASDWLNYEIVVNPLLGLLANGIQCL